MLKINKLAKPTFITIGLLTALAFDVPVQAGNYETRAVASGLTRPTGIVAAGNRAVVITQLPTPGIPGTQGGANTVDLINLRSHRLYNLATGEPEPTNITLDQRGHLYWTCKSAGVILERNRKGDIGLFLDGLTQPSGIDVDRWGRVYFTQIPTPGIPGTQGGANSVSISDGETTAVLSLGEPEPTDITVSSKGTAYWTCKSAGVILCRTPDGTKVKLLSDLAAPTGITLDEHRSRLYFTEVPTPGLPGSMGGLNRVSVLNLRSGKLETVDEGDPEPTDITTAPNGSVYWTCSSAGVIVQARQVRDHCDWNRED